MDKASASGSGWVSVRNTYHYGIAGWYSLQALERQMIGLSMTNSSCVVAPLWGKERMLGTNPIAMAFPARRERPMVVDFATSVVPLGRVEECARKAQRLLPGWAIGRDGEETTDPSEVMGGGCLLNLGGDFGHGGHKGYCLSAMVDVLCAVLSGGNWGPLVDGLLLGRKSPHGGVGINSRSGARDLLEIARRVGVSPPFDEADVDLSRVKRVIVDHA